MAAEPGAGQYGQYGTDAGRYDDDTRSGERLNGAAFGNDTFIQNTNPPY